MVSRGALADDRQVQALAAVERHAAAQTRVIDDLFEASRAASGRLRLACYDPAPPCTPAPVRAPNQLIDRLATCCTVARIASGVAGFSSTAANKRCTVMASRFASPV